MPEECGDLCWSTFICQWSTVKCAVQALCLDRFPCTMRGGGFFINSDNFLIKVLAISPNTFRETFSFCSVKPCAAELNMAQIL